MTYRNKYISDATRIHTHYLMTCRNRYMSDATRRHVQDDTRYGHRHTHTDTHTDTETETETQTDTETHTQTETETEIAIETETETETKTETDIHREKNRKWTAHNAAKKLVPKTRSPVLKERHEQTCVTWLIHMCDATHSRKARCAVKLSRTDLYRMTHWNVCWDSFICVTWVIFFFLKKSPARAERAWWNDLRHLTRLFVWYDSFIGVTWLIHLCDMTHSYVWYDSFICVTWLIRTWDMTHSYV